MPLYEYRCQDCGERQIVRLSFSDSSTPSCPICDSENTTRLISRVSIITSERDRVRDLSWVDKDMARRMKKKASGKLNPEFQDTLDRMESS